MRLVKHIQLLLVAALLSFGALQTHAFASTLPLSTRASVFERTGKDHIMPDTTTTTVRLRNTTAHLKHVSLAGGELITIPPTETGPGIVLKLESDAERVGFQRAFATKAVKAWIDAGELVIDGDVPSVSQPVTPPVVAPADTSDPAVPPVAESLAAAEPPTPQTQRTAVEPAQTTRRSSGRDHDR